MSHTKKPMTDKVKVDFEMDTPLSKNREVPAVASTTWVLYVWSTSYEKSSPLTDLCFMEYVQHITFSNPAGNYMFKVNGRNTRTKCEICSELTIKIPARHQWLRSGTFIAIFQHTSHVVLVFLLLTLSRWMPTENG